jgi:UDP-N-acetylmuramate: L-alanyl-gamma-D-glutamyl-meso-diaminopimelate ligase
MHVHILGICGTFMGGIAALAKAAGHTVTGSDSGIYPPMSDELERLGIEVYEGWSSSQFSPRPDIVIIGNAMSRGNEAVEFVLNEGLDYESGPAWLAHHVLRERWVLAVAGTHGKTTTTSLLAWILDYAGLEPGFLIGGVAENFGLTARFGGAPFFVIEADEYDTAFFDKRSKFVHYRPRTLILNNLEFDHADIFADLDAIEWQFHQLLRTVPANGRIVVNAGDRNLARLRARGCWTPAETFRQSDQPGWSVAMEPQPLPERHKGAEWQVEAVAAEAATRLEVRHGGSPAFTAPSPLLGQHNAANALAALLAARHAGVPLEQGVEALARFTSVKRRLEVIGQPGGITVYDDFAHHPTAIRATLQAVRAMIGDSRLAAVLEPRSNTMQMGVHASELADSLVDANGVWVFRADSLQWEPGEALAGDARVLGDVDAIVAELAAWLRRGDHVVIMSNGGFGGLHRKLLAALSQQA